MPQLAMNIEGKKYMWDKVTYQSDSEAKAKMEQYKKNGFETTMVRDEGGQVLVYTRRIAANVVVEGQPQ